MMFAAHVGVDINTSLLHVSPITALFSEGLGAVVQIKHDDMQNFRSVITEYQLDECVIDLGRLNTSDTLNIMHQDKVVYQKSRIVLQRMWSSTSYRMQSLRDHPECAKQEYDQILDQQDPGLQAELTFALPTVHVHKGVKPKVAILREQGVNGHMEMAASFDMAGFAAIDVHMTDILSGNVSLSDFQGLAACGGFSYGDVLGAGRGWAQSILLNPRAFDEFSQFFHQTNTFALGVCNGCQMMSQLKSIIPGADFWPRFEKNVSMQFESRLSLVRVQKTQSLFFDGMQGSLLPIVVAHGEGRAVFSDDDMQHIAEQHMTLRYADHYGHHTDSFPANPNGSPDGVTGLSNKDGRFTIMMPHPERVVRSVQYSWHPDDWGEYGPWLQLFQNARKFL